MESLSAHTLLQKNNVWTSKTLEKEGKLPSNQCFSGRGDRKRESGAVWGAGMEGGPVPSFCFRAQK